jgi:hypothetical protein
VVFTLPDRPSFSTMDTISFAVLKEKNGQTVSESMTKLFRGGRKSREKPE